MEVTFTVNSDSLYILAIGLVATVLVMSVIVMSTDESRLNRNEKKNRPGRDPGTGKHRDHGTD